MRMGLDHQQYPLEFTAHLLSFAKLSGPCTPVVSYSHAAC
jgi:hypothetical protein